MYLENGADYGRYMHDYIKRMCELGSRVPGSEEERRAAFITAEIMKEFADEVKIEEFEVAPHAFLGWIKIASPMLFLSLIFHFIYPLISSILLLLVIAMFVGEFLLYYRLLDPFFPKKKSHNVIATIYPLKEVRQTLVFSGHIDSAFEFNFIRWFGKRGHTILVELAIFVIISFFVINFATLLFGENKTLYYAFLLILFPGMPTSILFFFFTTWNGVPGAGDNLSAISVAMGVGEYLRRMRERKETFPLHTKVVIAIFGSEESGLRGSQAYIERHRDEVLSENVAVVNMETIVSPQSLYIVTRDMNGIVPLSENIAVEMAEVMESMQIPYHEIKIPLGAGATDAATFARHGIETTCIMGINPHGKEEYLNHYHTRRDTPDKVDVKALIRALQTCLGYLKMKDEIVSEK